MTRRAVGKRYGGPWYSNFMLSMRFERGAYEHYPSLSARNIHDGHELYREYTLDLPVKHYGLTRRVKIKMFPIASSPPSVTCDGPEDSPHRYDSGDLCMWYPYSSKSERWVFEDGLFALIVYVEAHLFREEWWRETEEWLGPEVSHSSPASFP